MTTHKAREAGMHARWRGKPITSNPCTGLSAKLWADGWRQAGEQEPPPILQPAQPVLTKHGVGVFCAQDSEFKVNRGFFIRTFGRTWR